MYLYRSSTNNGFWCGSGFLVFFQCVPRCQGTGFVPSNTCIAFGFGPNCCITLYLGVRLERLCVRRHNEATKLEKVRVFASQISE